MGKVKIKPCSNAADGRTRCPLSKISDNSPTAVFNRMAGSGNQCGRLYTLPIVLPNSSFVTGCGAVALTGPAMVGF